MRIHWSADIVHEVHLEYLSQKMLLARSAMENNGAELSGCQNSDRSEYHYSSYSGEQYTVLIDSSDHLSMDIKEYLDLRLACIVYMVRLFNFVLCYVV